MKPTPIALGITDLDVGGAEKQLLLLALNLDRRQWAPEVVCLQPEGPLAARLRDGDVPVRSLNLRGWRDVPRAAREWTAALRAQEPALLQTFLFHANVLGRFAGRRAGVPRIVSGVRVAEPRAAHRWLDWFTAGRADFHVCVSRAVAEHCQRGTGVAAARIGTIPNAVEPTADARPVDWSAWGIPRGTPVVVAVGRLERQKGPDVLLKAVARLARAADAPKFAVAFVGAGSLRPALEAEVAALDLGERVRFVGWQARPQDFIAASAGLALASRWEGMPNAVLEAFALGKPVIAAAVEGTEELVLPGETGWLLEPGDDDETLAEALRQLLDDPARAAAYGANGKELAERDFSVSAMVANYERLWRRLLATPG